MSKAPAGRGREGSLSSQSPVSANCCALNNVNLCSACEDLTARTRNAILNLIKEAEKNKNVHFNKTELSILMHMCVEITGREVRDMTVDELKSFLYGTLDITNPFSLDGLCRAAMILRGNGLKRSITPVEFINLLSVLLRGTLLERAEMAFHVIDFDSDGLIRRNVEIRRLLMDTFDVSVAAQNPEIDPEEPLRDTVNYLCDKIQCTMTQPITLERFKALAVEEPWIIESLVPCMPAEMTNLVFQTLFSTQTRLPSLENPPK